MTRTLESVCNITRLLSSTCGRWITMSTPIIIDHYTRTPMEEIQQKPLVFCDWDCHVVLFLHRGLIPRIFGFQNDCCYNLTATLFPRYQYFVACHAQFSFRTSIIQNCMRVEWFRSSSHRYPKHVRPVQTICTLSDKCVTFTLSNNRHSEILNTRKWNLTCSGPTRSPAKCWRIEVGGSTYIQIVQYAVYDLSL